MTAVTQSAENLLGGVSTQADFKKDKNQVRQATNAYVEPSFGLCKRPGSEFILNFGTEDEFKDAKWFFYIRDSDETYIGAIQKRSVRIFNVASLAESTVTVEGSALDYLSSDNFLDYRTITIQDNTIILNRQVEVEALADPTYVSGKEGTVVLTFVDYSSEYSVTVEGKTFKFTTRNSDQLEADGTGKKLNADEILSTLKSGIENLNISGLTVTQLKTSLELKRTSAFTLSAKGGANNEALRSFQDSVTNVSMVPSESIDGRIVKIENTTRDDDDYYIQYSTDDEAWNECKDPKISEGLIASTMPHELISTEKDKFTFKAIAWEKRLAGDQNTNPDPSFVGSKINGMFFTNSRLGFLSGPHVVMSVTSDYYNFFGNSALTVIDSDPIDLNCNSTTQTNLSYALPVPQGVTLFSNRQQFLMTADQQVYTPSSTFIRQISNYEVDEDIEAIDLGTYQIFLQRSAGYTKVFAMQIPDVNTPPIVIDISKVVAEWIPNTIDNMVSSAVNEFIVLSSRTSNEIYLYRKYDIGNEEIVQAWSKWIMPGKPVHIFTPNDEVYITSLQGDSTATCRVSLDKTLKLPTVGNDKDEWSNPFLDFYTTEVTLGAYNKAKRTQRVYVPYAHADGCEPLVLTTQAPTQALTYTNLEGTEGWYIPVMKDANGDVIHGVDGTGNYYEVQANLTSVTEKLVVGYKYAFEIEFPEIFYQKQSGADFTAHLTISRIKFAVGLTGALGFKLLTRGRDDWYDIQPIVESDYYTANTGPLAERYYFNVPIHQRSPNFMIKAFSDLPYPVCMNMMTWEGNYTPRFYRRM